MNYNRIIVSKGNEEPAFGYIENELGIIVPDDMRRGLHLRQKR